MEIADYATYDGATVMFDVMGFGKPLDEVPMLFQPGVLGHRVGNVDPAAGGRAGHRGRRDHRKLSNASPPPRRSTSPPAMSPKGSVAALRFEIRGMVDGQPAIVVEHVTRLREDLRPDWPQPAQPGGSYRVEITGEPSYGVDICPTSRKGDHNHAAIVGGRRSHRQRDPRGGRRAAGHPDHAGPAADHRQAARSSADNGAALAGRLR